MTGLRRFGFPCIVLHQVAELTTLNIRCLGCGLWNTGSKRDRRLFHSITMSLQSQPKDKRLLQANDCVQTSKKLIGWDEKSRENSKNLDVSIVQRDGCREWLAKGNVGLDNMDFKKKKAFYCGSFLDLCLCQVVVIPNNHGQEECSCSRVLMLNYKTVLWPNRQLFLFRCWFWYLAK